ncbi:MAG: hypothetical protein GEU78_09020 [Actinobacteria bacterium]|nr:hypothetical protein [Actinomycetota bacterium]
MNRRIRRLGFAFGGLLLATIVWVRLFPTAPEPQPTHPTQAANPTAAAGTPGDATSPLRPSPDVGSPSSAGAGFEESGGEGTNDPNIRTYAVSTFDLQGLPPDATGGTLLEVWVAWEPPIVDSPRYQKLLPEVRLEKVVPGLTPDAPATALLQVKVKELADLLYADRWGQLSVAALP